MRQLGRPTLFTWAPCGVAVTVHMTTSGDRLQPQGLRSFLVPLTPESRTGALLWESRAVMSSLSWFHRGLRLWSSQNSVGLWEAIEVHLAGEVLREDSGLHVQIS